MIIRSRRDCALVSLARNCWRAASLWWLLTSRYDALHIHNLAEAHVCVRSLEVVDSEDCRSGKDMQAPPHRQKGSDERD